MRSISAATLLLATAGPLLAVDVPSDRSYRSVDGTIVHVPYEHAAKCFDGHQSVSCHNQETCSHHQGVAA
jgi:hypothetical protein